ncbi:hypothetical protein [Oceanidesulfovibrio marinus]|uniref:Uncharacterized protein n=1 Tax=Oceanidesulfovibrio marinus TaxID=370038 RepID=A0ABX6NE89_9BACT|nr:hypothetical protein [Oceanidesulfovibrio marinus]QJT08925.1 hypothetical protein E8L03_08275 [Oceanidesulfovibrio marinus]
MLLLLVFAGFITLPARAQAPAPLPQDMQAHLARHKALQTAMDEARSSLESYAEADPAEQGVVNYFLMQLDLMEALAQNAFDLSFLYYDRVLVSQKAGNILAGYLGQRLTLLADGLFETTRSFRERLDAVPALRAMPAIAGVLPAAIEFTNATGVHAEDILSHVK